MKACKPFSFFVNTFKDRRMIVVYRKEDHILTRTYFEVDDLLIGISEEECENEIVAAYFNGNYVENLTNGYSLVRYLLSLEPKEVRRNHEPQPGYQQLSFGF